MSYKEIRDKILNSWDQNDSVFRENVDSRRYETRIKDLLEKFIQPSKRDEFLKLVHSTQDMYLKKISIMEKDYNKGKIEIKNTTHTNLIKIIEDAINECINKSARSSNNVY
jgi:hypothetical protein